MRRKPWARPELAAAKFFIDEPKLNKGRWNNCFKRPELPLWLELGCGKGVSTASFACDTPEINLLAVDIKSEVLAVAKRNAEKEYLSHDREIDNLLLTAQNIEYIEDIVDENDKIQCLLINFCNPWPRKKCNKHRLTHPRQLEKYNSFLVPDAIVLFKTDDDGLFEDSLEYFKDSGYIIEEAVWDLPASHPHAKYLSEYERLFREKNMPIHYLKAKLLKK